MKRKIMACLLSAVVSMGLAVNLETRVWADTTVIKEKLEDSEKNLEAVDANWRISQSVDAASCQQGDTITLTVQLTGDVDSIQMSSVYGRLQYDQEVFKVEQVDFVPYMPESVVYTTFEETSGEVKVYYAEDVCFRNGTSILKLKLHVLSDAEAGATKVGIKGLELYATDSDDYAVIENENTVKVTIKKKDVVSVKLGDVNQDKKINLMDVKMIIKYCNGEVKLTTAQKKLAHMRSLRGRNIRGRSVK